ncbi:hypothetical protein XHC_0221 [Xanthomonas hortorum pv. carotae str. M081]|nr:hypothetical protein XHC_0221 [Xanthomonas hortorum pv. carotae str. M081]
MFNKPAWSQPQRQYNVLASMQMAKNRCKTGASTRASHIGAR